MRAGRRQTHALLEAINSLRALMRMRGITASAWFFRVRACRFVCVFILGVGPQTKPRFVLRVLESLVSS